MGESKKELTQEEEVDQGKFPIRLLKGPEPKKQPDNEEVTHTFSFNPEGGEKSG